MSDTPWFDGFRAVVAYASLPDPEAFTLELIGLCERHRLPPHMAPLYCAAAIGALIGPQPISAKERMDAVEKSIAILRDATTAAEAARSRIGHA